MTAAELAAIGATPSALGAGAGTAGAASAAAPTAFTLGGAELAATAPGLTLSGAEAAMASPALAAPSFAGSLGATPGAFTSAATPTMWDTIKGGAQKMMPTTLRETADTALVGSIGANLFFPQQQRVQSPSPPSVSGGGGRYQPSVTSSAQMLAEQMARRNQVSASRRLA